MQITLDPELQRFVEQQALREGYGDASQYIVQLLDREWKRQLGEPISNSEREALAQRLAEGAAKRSARDRELANDWAPLEEELYGQEP